MHAFASFTRCVILRNNVRIEQLEVRRLLAGELDPGFGGGDGIVTTDFAGHYDEAYALALYEDGRIVAAGRADGELTGRDIAVSRYLSDGTLDPAFDGDGRVVVDINGSEWVQDVVVQPDGKVLVAGHVFNFDRMNEDMFVVRLNEDGSLDSSFGTGGIALIDLSDTPGGSSDVAHAMALQPDGKIVLAGGSIRNNSNDGSGQNIAVARVNPDGTLDPSFGTDGWVRTNHNEGFGGSVERARGVVVYPDGRIAVAGETRGQLTIEFDIILARYTTNGAPDTSFGPNGNGVVITEIHPDASESEDHAFDLLLQPDAKLVAAGSSFARGVAGSAGHTFALVRYDLDGNLDPTFGGGDGIVTTNIDPAQAEIATGAALAPDGKLVAVGFQSFEGGPASTELRQGSGRRPDLVMARYNPDGSVDAGFGSGGFVETPYRDDFADAAQDVLVQPDNNVLVAGTVQFVPQQSRFSDFVIERFVGEPGPDDTQSPTSESAVFDFEQAAHEIRFTFSEDVSASIDRADLHLVNTRTGEVVSPAGIAVTYDNATNTVTFTFPGAPDGTLAESSWRAELHRSGVRDAAGNVLAPSAPLEFTFIRGDANGDGEVNFDDYVAIDNGFNNGLTGFSNGDFNYDGEVNFDDYVLIDLAFNGQ